MVEMKMKFKPLQVILMAAVVFLHGCAAYTEPAKRFEDAKTAMKDAQDIRNTPQRYLNGVVVKSIYVEQMKAADADKPKWFFKDKSINLSRAPFETVLSNTFYDEAVQFRFNDGLDLKRLVTVKSEGTLGDALDAIANVSGYSYTIDGQVVAWSGMQYKSFDISMFAGGEDYGIGKSGSSSAAGQESFSDIETVSNNVISSGDEYIHLSGRIDIVSDIEKSLNMLKSASGEVIINSATMSVIAHDLPANIQKMQRYMDSLNEQLTRLVAIDMTIVNIELNDSFAFGLDWQLVAKELAGTGLDLSTGGGSFMTDIAGSNAPIYTLTRTTGKWSGTNMLMKALQSQGSVSNQTLPRATTLNNRAVKLRDIRRTNFILERSITTTANVGSEGSIKQGTVETGFSLYAIPRIANGEVILRLTTNLSTLVKLERKDSSTGASSGGSSGGSSSNQEVYVEAPIVNDKDFDNSVVISSGDSLVLAGLSTNTTSSQDSNNGADILGTSKTADGKRVETLILITPTILRGVRTQ